MATKKRTKTVKAAKRKAAVKKSAAKKKVVKLQPKKTAPKRNAAAKAKNGAASSNGLPKPSTQPWGQAGSMFVFTQQIKEPDRTRTTLMTNLSVRLTRNFSVNGSGTYARIRDQFTLERGEATEEEVLLRLRQLATGHRYSVSVGFSFSFGSLSNATVNPRFTR